jgi:hypothetical protein
MDFFSSYLSLLETRYPETARAVNLRERLSPLLFCPQTLKLPKHLRNQALAFARTISNLRALKERDQRLSQLAPALPDPGNYSALMSYDFHVDSEGNLRLIEINTNASMSLMTDLLYRLQGLPNTFSEDFPRAIIDTFKNEYQLSAPGRGKAEVPARELKRVVIVDEKPEQQRLYVEFEAYRELFAREGYEVDIADSGELEFKDGELSVRGKRVDLVYNRDTDFYFEAPSGAALKQAMQAQVACISPHPHEYRLLADKERLMELSAPGAIEHLPLEESDKKVLRTAIIPAFLTRVISDPDELWALRKKLFFKPMRSYGGKAVYRGHSISRSVFAQILAGDYLAQEFVPPGTVALTGEDGVSTEFKYDLRFFVYRDQVQLACARLYQGQMTNSQTPGGGIAAIEWV